jgi:hypothetical protein
MRVNFRFPYEHSKTEITGGVHGGLAIGALCAASLVVRPAPAWWDGGHTDRRSGAGSLWLTVRAKVDALIQLKPDYSRWVDRVADADKLASPSSTPRLGLATSRERLAIPTRATL